MFLIRQHCLNNVFLLLAPSNPHMQIAAILLCPRDYVIHVDVLVRTEKNFTRIIGWLNIIYGLVMMPTNTNFWTLPVN